MIKKTNTNIELITKTAIDLLELPITKKDFGDYGIVYHPFFNSIVVPYQNQLINIFNDTNKFNEYKNELKSQLKLETSPFRIIYYMNKPYRLLFLSLIQNYLDNEIFANLLKECYTETEFPNRDVNVSVAEIKKMFEKAVKTLLMDIEEQNTLQNLPDEITIYRGFYSNKYYNALSWTLDINKARFFATRFQNHNGCIYKANIKKENIYAYFNCRNEKEIVVDYNKLYNISKKEQFK